MAEVGERSLFSGMDVANTAIVSRMGNGIAYSNVGATEVTDADVERMVGAVPVAIAAALSDRAYYFVPLVMTPVRGDDGQTNHADNERQISIAYTAALGDEALCHRNLALDATPDEPAREGVFISARMFSDRFALFFEFFINVAHPFVDHAGVSEEFSTLAWAQAMADVRGETSQDAWEARTAALANRARIDEKAKTEYLEAAFSDALAIYLLSLALDFDYSELREREYPLLAPHALAERLRLVAKLFPPNAGYEFSVRYRRR